MTVPSTTRRAGPFTGTGVLVSFAFTFRVFEEGDVAVTISDADGIETAGVLNSSFLVTLNIDQDTTPGGSVQYAVGGVATALPLGYTLGINGAREYSQEADLPQGGNFNARTVEDALDSLEIQIQQIRDNVERSVRLTVLSPLTTDATLPIPEAAAVLGWNSDGTALQNYTPDTTVSADVLRADIASSANVLLGDGLLGVKHPSTGGAARTQHQKNQDWLTIQDFGGVGDGTTDDTTAINNAIAASVATNRRLMVCGVFRHTSQITVPAKASLVGLGWTSAKASGSRSLSCFVKDFNGIGFLFSGDDASTDGIQYDSTAAKTGDGVQVTGSRVMLRNGASTNHGNDGVRIGKTEAGATSINANCFRIDNWISIANGRDGINVDHTNTTTSGTYPLGAPDVNAGMISNVFLGSTGAGNGRDGLRVANSIDCVLKNIVSQLNTGNGIRFTTSARGHKIFGYYCESNTAGGLLFDSGAHSNVALGGHAVIGSQTAVDNDGSNMILAPSSAAGFNGAFFNFLKVCNPAAAGSADFDAYCDTNFINAYRMKATQPSGSRGRWTLQTKANGGALADRIVVDETGVTIPSTTNGVLFNKTAVDTTTPGINIEGGSVARTDHVNSGTGASTVHAFYNGNGQVGSISTSGTATAYNVASDRKLKTNFRPFDFDAAAILRKTLPGSYNWLADGTVGHGYIAQTLHRHYPPAASKPTGRGRKRTGWQVDNSKMVPVLHVRLVEVDTEVAELRKLLSAAMKRIAKLEAKS